jgi:hypothetical protein
LFAPNAWETNVSKTDVRPTPIERPNTFVMRFPRPNAANISGDRKWDIHKVVITDVEYMARFETTLGIDK